MAGAFGSLIRGLAVLALFACGLAVCVARLVPRPSAFRLWSEPRYGAFNATFFAPIREQTEILDTQTGALQPLRLPKGETLHWVGFSNWVDERGESVVAGRWAAFTGPGWNRQQQAVGIGRFAFPSGRPIDRVRAEPVPSGALCWFPGSASRILFSAGDGRLYRYEFSQIHNDGGAVIEGHPQPIVWPNPPSGVGQVWIQKPTWPTDPRLEGRLFAVVRFYRRESGRKERRPHQIWWLRLDAARTSVMEAGRLSRDEPDGGTDVDPSVDERLPQLVHGVGGELLLTYQVTRTAAPLGELRVARIEFDPDTHAPTICHARSRTLIHGCAGTSPVFTPSGDALFALASRPSRPTVLRRIDRAHWFRPETVAAGVPNL